MSSLEQLQKKTVASLSQALLALESMPANVQSRADAIDTVSKVRTAVGDISLNGYYGLRKTKQRVDTVFLDPINGAIEKLTAPGILNLPYDMGKILEQQNRAQPDVSVLDKAAEVNKHVKSAHWYLRQMKNPVLRFMMGGWVLVLIFAAALLYAVYYFVFHAADVANPTSHDGAQLVVAKAKAGIGELQATLDSSGGVVEATSKFVDKLTKLVSKLPPLLAAFGVLFASVRKLVAR